MISSQFEHISNLQNIIRNQEHQINALKSGEAIVALKQAHARLISEKESEIRKLNTELSTAHRTLINMRKNWLEVFEDVEKECAKAIRLCEKEKKTLEKRICEKEERIKYLRDIVSEQGDKISKLYEEIEEKDELIKKLTAQVNRDFENSSVPSSKQGVLRKKIPNSREQTGRKPGAQPGHKGHSIKLQEPTTTTMLPAPEAVLNEADKYYKTKEVITKQKVRLRVSIETEELKAEVYRNRETGTRIHAEFPPGFSNTVNYDGSLKGFLYLLCNRSNVSIEHAIHLLSELTHGKLNVSKGTVSKLISEFSIKTESEQQEIISGLLTSPVMNADFTTSNVNGKLNQVLILASAQSNECLYIYKEKKGLKGVEGTPLESYVGTVVHDHESTFYNYGTQHQECHQHNLRYLKGSIENEPEYEWNKKMYALLREMIHYRNSMEDDEEFDKEKVKTFIMEYDKIIAEGKREYEENPPSKYYREGINLLNRLENYKESQLLFLTDKKV